MELFKIESNWGDYYSVLIHSSSRLTVFKQNQDKEFSVSSRPIIELTRCKRIFLGENVETPATKFSGSWKLLGKALGNSILADMGQNKYVCIHNEEIFEFTSKSKIVSFFSPIGNNNVTYPYAVDDQLRFYVFIQKEIMTFLTGNVPIDPNYHEHPISRETLVGKQLDPEI